ncbi:acylneuraminate cytidylyltransferase [Candidatus Thioglobus autotrophicus]|jgi:YrbI family 3-deoxy-D-manno-octulosonate 8-phosphate phosphatase|uniref:acylneuraminate cytidylyltransferase n=1 Tax=Candidatus Thioglobus autotrophicus TaxID=1705394 RepID=UPI00299CF2CD|nr:acylneuraminate cytidylyltransferase [Candidatus Thioglobus autotrophicus]WPE15942.1 acylneuraminate cytidylyltransferase [Candidatus Thioglobus autotrophicus]
MKIISVIPARGGSKGVVNKNLQMVNGIPLVARSVIASKSVKEISETYVSSDSGEILEVGKMYGAKSINRPSVFSDDTSSTEDVLLHFIEVLAKKNIKPDVLVYLQCTSPFTTSIDIKIVIDSLLSNEQVDCAFSAIEDHSFLWKVNRKYIGKGVNHKAYEQRSRRQDLSITYRENGAVYAVRVPALLRSKNRFGATALPVIAGGNMPFEIDNITELRMARMLTPLLDNSICNFQLQNCKALVMDFDGVHTNDKVVVDQNGMEAVTVSRADGLGIGILKKMGVKVLILTREENDVVLVRAEKLGVEIKNGVTDKLSLLKTWAKENRLTSGEIAYVGNDINDLECLQWVSFPFVPNDLADSLKSYGFAMLNSKGGDGVIREIANIFGEKI